MKEHDVIKVKATGAIGTIVYIYNDMYAVELLLGNCLEDFCENELEIDETQLNSTEQQ